jgi:hypothetical protein
LSGKYGQVLPTASLAIDDTAGLAAAAVITLYQDTPLLTFSLTHPRRARRGMAACLIRTAARALVSAGHRELRLVVTDGNVPAQRLYRKLGFAQGAPPCASTPH